MSKKSVTIMMWICISLLSIQFFLAGIGKLSGSWAIKFKAWGYPPALMYATGLLEIIAVVGLFIYQTRKWSAIVLVFIMGGASYTHISNAEYSRVIHNVIITGVSVLVIYLNEKVRKN
jgi:uncharacterized membrane protein YphA (DoxX/SURF4 family)